MPVLAAVMKMIFALTFFSSCFVTSGGRLKTQKAVEFIKVQAQNSRPTVGDMVIVLDTENTRAHFRSDCNKRFVVSTDAEDHMPYKIVGHNLWLFEEDLQLVADHTMLVDLVTTSGKNTLTSKMVWGDAAHAEFTDASILAAGGRSFAVHRNVLAAASPFFRSAFSVPMREAADRQINMTDASAEAVEAMLAFIYSQELDESRTFVMLPLAHRYEVVDLADACIASMARSANATNIVSTVLALKPLVGCLASAQAAWKQVLESAAKHPQLLEELALHVHE